MDISALRDRPNAVSFSVTELNNLIKGIFDSNRLLNAISVRGEISNFKRHSSGHLYFSLKDDGAQVRAVMFRSRADLLKFVPENGMKVTVHGSVTVYSKDGSYQIYVNSIQPDGIGALYLAFEQLKKRLEEEGMFDQAHKKSIPRFPMKVGVITSPTGAAIRDIINVAGRRFPLAKIYLYPSIVQGEQSEESLLRALEYFESSHLVDVIIIGRGGGSIEDLWSFNSEKLARAIYKATTPIVSAVGHETDFTICDFVADLRAPTPSAGAEMVVPDIKSLIIELDDSMERATISLARLLERKRDSLIYASTSPLFKNPVAIFAPYYESFQDLSKGISAAFESAIKTLKARLDTAVVELNALNPLSVLLRGYSVSTSHNNLVSGVKSVEVGDTLETRLHDGVIRSTICEIIQFGEENGKYEI